MAYLTVCMNKVGQNMCRCISLPLLKHRVIVLNTILKTLLPRRLLKGYLDVFGII